MSTLHFKLLSYHWVHREIKQESNRKNINRKLVGERDPYNVPAT